jgi:hypothetical protein
MPNKSRLRQVEAAIEEFFALGKRPSYLTDFVAVRCGCSPVDARRLIAEYNAACDREARRVAS